MFFPLVSQLTPQRSTSFMCFIFQVKCSFHDYTWCVLHVPLNACQAQFRAENIFPKTCRIRELLDPRMPCVAASCQQTDHVSLWAAVIGASVILSYDVITYLLLWFSTVIKHNLTSCCLWHSCDIYWSRIINYHWIQILKLPVTLTGTCMQYCSKCT